MNTTTNPTVALHWNGEYGASFHVVLFDDSYSRKVGIVFGNPLHTAVLDVAKLASGNIETGYRGDCYDTALRDIVEEFRIHKGR